MLPQDPVMVAKQEADPTFQPDPEYVVAFFLTNDVILYIPFSNKDEVNDVLDEVRIGMYDEERALVVTNSAEPTNSVIDLTRLICATALIYKEWVEAREGGI